MSDNISPSQCKACPVCLETKRDARLLPCLHSLCRGCIDNLAITAGKDAPCPVCRGSFHIPEVGGAVFPKDSVTPGKPAANCDECGEEQATMFCRSCQVFVCDAHMVSHCRGNSGERKRHLFTDVCEAFGAQWPEGNKSNPAEAAFPCCSDHGEQMNYHCEDCNTPICGDCVVIGEHRGHNAKRAKDIVSQRKEEVEKKLDKLRADIEPRLVKSIEDVDDVTSQLTARADQVRDEIRSATVKAVQMVQAVGEQLLQQVLDIEEKRRKLLDEQRDALKCHLDCVRNAISFADCLLEKELRAEYLPLLVTLENRVKYLSEEEIALEPVKHAKLGFQCTEDSAIASKAFEITGQVLPYPGSGKHSTVEGSTKAHVSLGEDTPAEFVLQVKDEQDTPVDTKHDEITTRWLKVPVSETSKVPVTITSQGQSGEYLLSTRPTQPGKYELEVAVNRQVLPMNLSVKVSDRVRFDANECHPEIQLSADRLSATVTQGRENRSVLGSVGMRRGQFSWKIRIGSLAHWHGLGIASKPLSNRTSNHSDGYGWSSTTNKYGLFHDNRALSPWSSYDCIHFTLDCDQHTLQMTNTRSGEAHEITGLPEKEFFVWINIYEAGNSAEFVY